MSEKNVWSDSKGHPDEVDVSRLGDVNSRHDELHNSRSAHGDAHPDDDLELLPQKPAKKNGMVMRAVLVLLVLGTLGGAAAYFALGLGKTSRQLAPATPALSDLGAAGQIEDAASAMPTDTSVFGSPQAASDPASSISLAVPQDAPVDQNQGTPGATPPSQQTPQVAAGGDALPARLAEAERKVATLESKVSSMEATVAVLESRIAAQAQQRAAAPARAPRTEQTARRVEPRPASRPAAERKVASEAKGAATGTPAAAPASAPPAIPSLAGAPLALRGVFPPGGEDRQAWVLDGEQIRTLRAGDVIRGATVIAVERDRVRTTAGDITGGK